MRDPSHKITKALLLHRCQLLQIRLAELELIGLVPDDIGQYPVLDGHLLPGLARQDDLSVLQFEGALLVPFGTFNLVGSHIPEGQLRFMFEIDRLELQQVIDGSRPCRSNRPVQSRVQSL